MKTTLFGWKHVVIFTTLAMLTFVSISYTLQGKVTAVFTSSELLKGALMRTKTLRHWRDFFYLTTSGNNGDNGNKRSNKWKTDLYTSQRRNSLIAWVKSLCINQLTLPSIVTLLPLSFSFGMIPWYRKWLRHWGLILSVTDSAVEGEGEGWGVRICQS